ncbi:MAG: sigma 54-interacting transcriptional regulator [Lachnospiraceae bacterium]|nr:sigma 54-interacting transcriptional regulator [Lachnospiraceae bacterium]
MIRLLVIVPYPELFEKVCTALNSPKYSERLDVNVQLVTVDKIENVSLDGYDLVIGRGYTALSLSQKERIPVLPIPITSYDILRAIAECKKSFSPSPQKICCIGSNTDFYALSEIHSLLDTPIQVITNDNILSVEECIEQGIQNGCDAFIGGYTVLLTAQKKGIPSVVIKTGDEAIYQVLDEAIHIGEVAQARQIQNKIYRIIIQHSQDAILYVDRNHQIVLDNVLARTLARQDALIGKKLDQILPYLHESYKKALDTSQEIIGELHRFHERTYSITYTPLILKGSVDGVLIFCQDITRIQKLEANIRKTLSDKGLYAKYSFEDILHQSNIMEQTIQKARSFASTPSNIMLLGESGTGKELFAQSIHNHSVRRDGPFVAINCAALPENLLESELFGYVQGAFTGANKGGKTGLFELAHGGTLFLDEVSEISLNVQTKLLRVLQEREVRKIGDDNVISIDVRIICATNKNLKKLVEEGRFRQDLLYRLDVLRVFLPPLRQREQDILLLFNHMMKTYYLRLGQPAPELTREAQKLLLKNPFPGNVRELRNIVERVCVLHPDSTSITFEELEQALFPEDIDLDTPNPAQSVISTSKAVSDISEDTEYLKIQETLQRCGGNQSRAAKELGIDRSTLWRKLKKYQKL